MSAKEKQFRLKNGSLYYLRVSSVSGKWVLSKPGFGSLGQDNNEKNLIIQAEVHGGSKFDHWDN